MNAHNHDFPATVRAARPVVVAAAAEEAIRRIAPVWPLKHFVAVNPFLGLADRSFEEAAGVMAGVGARMTMPRAFYAEAIAAGRITDADLADALVEAGSAITVAGLKALAAAGEGARPAPVGTVADAAAAVTGTDWPAVALDRISAWAGAYFDEGQALWQAPCTLHAPFRAWRTYAVHDRTPGALGLATVRAFFGALPDTADEAIAACVTRLGVPEAALTAYFHRLLTAVGGWAAVARYRLWQAELHGGTDGTLKDLLAVRLAWDAALLAAFEDAPAVAAAWAKARTRAVVERIVAPEDLALQAAYENAWQRSLVARFAAAAPVVPVRKAVQAAFCIDVRSEVFRRALESTAREVETIGFAGFFGIPLDVIPLGHTHGGAHCPVLLTPKFTVQETAGDANATADAAEERRLARTVAKAWSSFKTAAVSSFAFVEATGLLCLPKLAADALHLSRPVAHPKAAGLAAPVEPSIAPGTMGDLATGIEPAARIEIAAAVLKAMSLTTDFARVVLLAGHGSTTVNNPHATALDCGACGGHTGEANARVAAAILNDPAVRAALPAKGIDVPADTLFLAGLHDTTTDEVTLYGTVPATHRADVEALRRWLAEAGRKARGERARLLGATGEAAVKARANDWSEVRPEWGLAGCAAFVAAPRGRTAGIDLEGRAFLHSYDHTADEGYRTLELIMTAPMVVASWISLQYYGSTVDNAAFGSGDKTLHNVVGTIGVLEGNGGDLRVGLPLQSVHDGARFVHEPMRLSVVIEAPVEAMNAVIARHEGVRHLLDNGWLHLFALGEGGIAARYRGGLEWTAVTPLMKKAA